MLFEPGPLAIYLNMPQISVCREIRAEAFSTRSISRVQNNTFLGCKIIFLPY